MNPKFHSGFVALIGRPNAGKSTLMNNLIGQKVAITSDKPQTTRNRIMGVLSKKDWQIIFLDTPGLHKPQDKLGEKMVKAAVQSLNDVDIIYFLVDVTVSFGSGSAYIIDKLKKVQKPVFLLLNKIDLIEKQQLLPLIEEYRSKFTWQEIVPISALAGDNLKSLVQSTVQYLPEGPRYYPEDAVTDQPERLIIAEFIREKVIELTREEVPHAVAVEVEIMERRTEELIYVGANIYTERETQKKILIGKKGEKIKQIGSRARGDIERLTGNKVFLELWVKVKPDWRNREKFLTEMGYNG